LNSDTEDERFKTGSAVANLSSKNLRLCLNLNRFARCKMLGYKEAHTASRDIQNRGGQRSSCSIQLSSNDGSIVCGNSRFGSSLLDGSRFPRQRMVKKGFAVSQAATSHQPRQGKTIDRPSVVIEYFPSEKCHGFLCCERQTTPTHATNQWYASPKGHKKVALKHA